ncbi:MAG: hypothetical protein HDS23_07030 [Bacteroides sp.]|nr:hypothetical protein [Bacteroides sp.]
MDRKENKRSITFTDLLAMLPDSELTDADIEVVVTDFEVDKDNGLRRAEKLKDEGKTVLGIGILPFAAVGDKGVLDALVRCQQLHQIADGCVLVNRESLRSKITPSSLSFSEEIESVEEEVDKIILNIRKGLSDILLPGKINIESSVLREVLRDCGTLLIVRGVGTGADKMEKALKEAFDKPAEGRYDINAARKMIIKLLVSRGTGLSMDELGKLQQFLSTLPNNIEVIFGTGNSNNNTAELEVVILATGVDVVLREDKKYL